MAISLDKVNRIIEVAAPDTEVTVQDLLNTLRDWEDDLDNMEMAKIADASGKDDLGDGLQVGITLRLLNWRVKFEDRAGPGTILCSVTGGNLVAVDTNNQPINPIAPASYVMVDRAIAVSAVAIETGVSGLTSEESARVMEIELIKAKMDNMPDDPVGMAALGAAHGFGSFEGATPTQLWEHTDRRLTSRSLVGGSESIPSEAQVNELKEPVGSGYDRETDSLKKLSEKLAELSTKVTKVGARFKV